MKIPFDGEPSVVGIASETEEVDWDDGPDVDLDFVPDYMAPVSAPSTKAIAFDIFGTILVSFHIPVACAQVAHIKSGS